MANFDDSDNPLKGFELVHWPEGLYLDCRGRECSFKQRLPRLLKLEQLLNLAAAHRIQCKRPVQAIKTKLALDIQLTQDLADD